MSRRSYPFYFIDAFTGKRHGGNQAAVCLVDKKLEDDDYQKLGAEFNVSETAFPLPLDGGDFKSGKLFSLRWFTPTVEVPLCGHATLATAHALREHGNRHDAIEFDTKSGRLGVKFDAAARPTLDFPQFALRMLKSRHLQGEPDARLHPKPFPTDDVKPAIDAVVEALQLKSKVLAIAYAGVAKKLIVVLPPETTRTDLESIVVSPQALISSHPEGDVVRGVMLTSLPTAVSDEKGDRYDYQLRYFAPWAGINEDPATGSAQCALAVYWATVLGKNELYGLQAYPRRGASFRCVVRDDGRLDIGGEAVTVVSGEVHL